MKKISLLFLLFFGLLNHSLMAQEVSKKTIIIYGSDECHHCIETKAFLKEKKIEFVFYDIDKNPVALQEMLLKLRQANISTSNLGIPVVDKNGKLFSNVGDFQEFLKKLE
ncbi:MAG: glutaredoxin family protein [Flavobacterium sp.]